eukprot:ctg_5744.g658
MCVTFPGVSMPTATVAMATAARRPPGFRRRRGSRARPPFPDAAAVAPTDAALAGIRARVCGVVRNSVAAADAPGWTIAAVAGEQRAMA